MSSSTFARRLRHLTTLVLDDNQLERLGESSTEDDGGGADDEKLFSDELEHLWLNGNRLSSVPRGLPANLRRLLMDFNDVEELTDPNTFHGLSKVSATY